MEIFCKAKVEIHEFEDEVLSIKTKWGQIRVSDEGLMFAGFPKGSLSFAIPADEILDMCMAWMREQQKERDRKAIENHV